MMIKFYRTVFVAITFFVSLNITAQVQKPVQFSFFAGRDAAGQAYISIKAKPAAGVRLFSAVRKSSGDVFVSSVDFDSSGKRYLKSTLQELGNLQTTVDSTAGGEVRFFVDSVEWKQLINISINDSAKIKGTVTWLASNGKNFPSGDETFSVKVKALNQPELIGKEGHTSLLSTFWLCLLTGLLAVLTPCVFPLVPVTVSFFLKRSKSKAEGIKKATWYSFSIILIYTIPTLILTFVFGANALYTISTHPVTNLLFFAILSFLLFHSLVLSIFHYPIAGQTKQMKKRVAAV